MGTYCVKGQTYALAMGDDFQSDTGINENNGIVPGKVNLTSGTGQTISGTTPSFSTQLWWGSRGGGSAYFMDPTLTGGYNPFSLATDPDGGRSLHIGTEKIPSQYAGNYSGFNWWTGNLNSPGLTYGYAHAIVSAPINDLNGWHTGGFWFGSGLSQTAPSPDLNEVDVFEVYGQQGNNFLSGYSPTTLDHLTVHLGGYGAGSAQSLGGWGTTGATTGWPPSQGQDLGTTFHDYAMLWTPTYVEMYIDGVPKTIWNGASTQFNATTVTQMFAIMNIYIDGSNGAAAPTTAGYLAERQFAWYQLPSNPASCSGGITQ